MLDMGEQVRIADIARRLIATGPRDTDIVFTGLRPGEKLSESCSGTARLTSALHPLISHVPVMPLAPTAVNLDPAA